MRAALSQPVRCHTIAAQAPPPPRHHSPRPASLYWPKVSRVWPKELRERSGSRLGKVHAAVPRRCVTAPHTPSASPRRTAFRGHAGECRACAAKDSLGVDEPALPRARRRAPPHINGGINRARRRPRLQSCRQMSVEKMSVGETTAIWIGPTI